MLGDSAILALPSSPPFSVGTGSFDTALRLFVVGLPVLRFVLTYLACPRVNQSQRHSRRSARATGCGVSALSLRNSTVPSHRTYRIAIGRLGVVRKCRQHPMRRRMGSTSDGVPSASGVSIAGSAAPSAVRLFVHVSAPVGAPARRDCAFAPARRVCGGVRFSHRGENRHTCIPAFPQENRSIPASRPASVSHGRPRPLVRLPVRRRGAGRPSATAIRRSARSGRRRSVRPALARRSPPAP